MLSNSLGRLDNSYFEENPDVDLHSQLLSKGEENFSGAELPSPEKEFQKEHEAPKETILLSQRSSVAISSQSLDVYLLTTPSMARTIIFIILGTGPSIQTNTILFATTRGPLPEKYLKTNRSETSKSIQEIYHLDQLPARILG